MIEQVKATIKEVQYRRLLKRSFEPRKEFLDSSRAAFLNEVTKRRVAPFAPQLAWHALGLRAIRYTAVLVAVALMGTSGLVAFADNTNVSVNSPLYPLKRVGEQVRLTVVPAKKEPELRKELAQRRASEIAEIEIKKQPEAGGDVEQLRKLEHTEKSLRDDFRKNVEKIEERSAATVILPESASETGLCRAAEVVEKHNGNGKSEAYKKFEDRCKDLLKTEEELHDTVPSTEIVPNGDHSNDTRVIETKKIEDHKKESDKNVDTRNEDRVNQE